MSWRDLTNMVHSGPDDPLDGRSLGLSLAIHVVAFVLLIWVIPALRPDPIVFEAVEIRVVSAPPIAAPEPEEEIPPVPEEELVVETPEDPVQEEEAPIPAEEEPPPPEPEETPPPEPEETPPATEEPTPAESEETEEDEGGQNIDVRMEGLKRDYPAYYDNIIRQIERCFRPPGAGNRVAVIQFMIQEDGSITDIGVARSSNSFVFDRAAEGAVECAGRPGRLGPLPDGYPWEVLPVQFRFRPGSSGARGQDLAGLGARADWSTDSFKTGNAR